MMVAVCITRLGNDVVIHICFRELPMCMVISLLRSCECIATAMNSHDQPCTPCLHNEVEERPWKLRNWGRWSPEHPNSAVCSRDVPWDQVAVGWCDWDWQGGGLRRPETHELSSGSLVKQDWYQHDLRAMMGSSRKHNVHRIWHSSYEGIFDKPAGETANNDQSVCVGVAEISRCSKSLRTIKCFIIHFHLEEQACFLWTHNFMDTLFRSAATYPSMTWFQLFQSFTDYTYSDSCTYHPKIVRFHILFVRPGYVGEASVPSHLNSDPTEAPADHLTVAPTPEMSPVLTNPTK